MVKKKKAKNWVPREWHPKKQPNVKAVMEVSKTAPAIEATTAKQIESYQASGNSEFELVG